MPPMPPGLSPIEQALWIEAERLQRGDPTLPVGITALARATGITIREADRIVRRLPCWPFPIPDRGGRHATARIRTGDGTLMDLVDYERGYEGMVDAARLARRTP